MNNIKAEIVAHSLNKQGDELLSVLVTMPRIILSEMNTHRMLSKNTSSSRAIPFSKMVEAVQNDPFIPIAWQKEHKGMQGSSYITEQVYINEANEAWLQARNLAVQQAQYLTKTCQVTKQLANRLLEPFSWTTMLITGSKEGWDNFFKLRNPSYCIEGDNNPNQTIFKSWKDLKKSFPTIINGDEDVITRLKLNKGYAEIHIMDLAEKIWDAKNESTPKLLKENQWHIPFENRIHIDGLQGVLFTLKDGSTIYQTAKFITDAKIKISVALSARTSYTVVGEEKEIDYEKMIDLHDRLLAQDPPHSSPLEHCCRAMTEDEFYQSIKSNRFDDIDTEHKHYGWCNNIKGFIPYRYMVDNNLEM